MAIDLVRQEIKRGDTSGNPIPAGYVGEILSVTSSLTALTSAWRTSSGLVVTPGIWMVQLAGYPLGGSGATSGAIGFSLESANTFGDQVESVNMLNFAVGTDQRGGCFFSNVINIASSATYYLKIVRFGANATSASNYYMRFIRIA